jgi:pilus assembly protein CpaF
MISIIISEKGGAERRERYDQNEVTIGRVKGNDVLLPKGNVSKRHARLIVRDGRYIVTDLKSTNGTYVNHRRITHATLVREGDRIYIGDFVLRIEGELGAHSSVPASPGSFTPDSSAGLSRSPSNSSVASAPPYDVTHAPGPLEDVVSHFPIEHDPDDSSPMLDVPGPPRVPTGFKTGQTGSTPAASSAPQTNEQARGSNPGSLNPGSMGMISSEPHTPHALRSSQPASGGHVRKAHRARLELLVSTLEEVIGLDALDAIEPKESLVETVNKAIDEQLEKQSEDAPLPEGLEASTLREAARAELLEIGPMTQLLADENITQVQVMLRDIVVHRRGRRTAHKGLGFATEAGIARALSRLCARAGVKLDDDLSYIEASLDEGRQLFAVRPPAAPEGHLVIIRQPRRARTTLNSLVRSGTISRGMATLLGHCITARANVLVVGGADSGSWELIEALAHAAPRHARAIWLRDPASLDQLPPDAASIDIGESAEQRQAAIRASGRLAAEHVIAPPLSGEDLATLLDGVTQGAEGVVMCAVAGTLRQSLERLSADLAAARPGLTPQTAREWLGSAFDLGLEVTRLRDGRLRVVRLAELRPSTHGTSVRDVFTFAYHRTAAGGSIEGAFYASGTVPRIVEDLAARGMPLDTSIFRRHPSA